MEELTGLKTAFKTTTLSELFTEKSKAPFVPIDLADEDSLLQVMILMGKYGIHNVWSVDNNEVVNVITQGAMLNILAKNIGKFGAITDTPIKHLGLGLPKHVCSVTQHDTYWEAFRVIHDHVCPVVTIHL